MIINDQHQLAFIHIPKCAGTSVRKSLQPFDSRYGMFTNRVDNHPDLGQLDYVHIPVYTLSEYFPEEFAAVRDYWSFAVMRDPLVRFASSVSQRMKMYSDQPIQKRSLREIRTVIDESIDYLSRKPRGRHLLPPEYIHFQKQADYIELDGVRILDRIYTVNQIDALMADVEQRVGQSQVESNTAGGVTQANRTVVFRNEFLRRVIETARPITDRLGKVLPESTKQMVRDCVYVPRDQRMKVLFESDDVQVFIRQYYADDIALYRQISQDDLSKTA